MLFPQDSESRDVRDLSGIWEFRADSAMEGKQQEWFKAPLRDSQPMPVPASFNDLTQDQALRDLMGEAWYERTFFVPREWQGKRVVLRFGAATHKSVVWVNGKEVMSNHGGYLPFETDLSEEVNYGAENRVTICINNILDMTTLPPGMIKEKYGKPFQDYEFDFFNYSGLHRPVRLYCTPKTYVDDITVITDLNGTTGIVKYDVQVAGDKADVAVRLLDAEGNEVAKASGAKGELSVTKANLWEPGHGYLYSLEVTTQADTPDVYRLPVGIRTVELKEGKFLVNGKPFYFKGFGKHEDMDIRGKGLDLAMVKKDFSLLKWIGANSFRTSHYPYAEEILQMADREGILVIDESPAVGMYIFKGKQDVWDEETLGPLLQHHLDVMERMVQRDKNHPSVVMWSVSNEAATQERGFEEYFRRVFAKTRQCDPQNRPVTIVVHTWYDNDVAVQFADLICLNRYWGWYGDPGRLEAIEVKGRRELDNWWKHQQKPMILSEFGADTIPGFHQDPPVVFSEEYQVAMLEGVCGLLDTLPFIIGEHVWNFADFMTKQGLGRVGGNKKGIFTRQRQPKSSAHFLRGRWTQSGPTGRPG